MDPDVVNTLQTILVTALGTGGIGSAIMGIRAWIRKDKEDEGLEVDLQDKVTAMADRWLEKAEQRLEKAEARAEKAESRMEELRREFDDYRKEKRVEQQRMIGQLQTVYDWIESGAQPPPPTWPAWLPRPSLGKRNSHG